jgi:signal transduction histidine kinase
VTTDVVLQQQLVDALAANGHEYHLPTAANLLQARRRLSAAGGGKGEAQVRPLVILVDDSAVGWDRWFDTLQELAGTAPVVALAGPNRIEGLQNPDQAGPSGFHHVAPYEPSIQCRRLKELLAAGRLEIVPKFEGAVPWIVGLLERHVRRAESAAGIEGVREAGGDATGDFGEVLRHEVNNPLTGILGNAELLLARRDQLPPAMAGRLETIAGLAIRLRETVRRLSTDWFQKSSSRSGPGPRS